MIVFVSTNKHWSAAGWCGVMLCQTRKMTMTISGTDDSNLKEGRDEPCPELSSLSEDKSDKAVFSPDGSDQIRSRHVEKSHRKSRGYFHSPVTSYTVPSTFFLVLLQELRVDCRTSYLVAAKPRIISPAISRGHRRPCQLTLQCHHAAM